MSFIVACGGATEAETTEEEPLEETEALTTEEEETQKTTAEDVIPTADETDEPVLDEMGKWVAIEDFHMEMAMTYHPVVDEGKIEVAKENAMKLAQSAQNLAGATPTPAFDHETARQLIDDLVVKTQDFANLINENPSDEDIKAALEDIHNTYHALEESKKAEQE